MSVFAGGYATLTTVTSDHQVVGTTDVTTVSTVAGDMPNMTQTFVTAANSSVYIFFSADVNSGDYSLTGQAQFTLLIDGVAEPNVITSAGTAAVIGGYFKADLSYVKTGLAAGAHTFKIQWNKTIAGVVPIENNAATGSMHRILNCIEVFR